MLLKLAFSFTGLWIVGLLLFFLYQWASIARLTPNELGDFLAGAFAPLAFLWLAVAVFMQKYELSLQRQELVQNRQALKQQADELRATVTQNEIQAQAMLAANQLNKQQLSISLFDLYQLRLSMACADLRYILSNRTGLDQHWQSFSSGNKDFWINELKRRLTTVGDSGDDGDLRRLRSGAATVRPKLERIIRIRHDGVSALKAIGATDALLLEFESEAARELFSQLERLQAELDQCGTAM